MEQEINLDLISSVVSPNDAKKMMQTLSNLILPHNKTYCKAKQNEGKDNTNPESNATETSPFKFPGLHPVTFLSKHIQLLYEMDYYVCEKSDGVRIFLWFNRNLQTTNCFFVDRKGHFYKFEIDCTGINECCFDGEIYIETVNGQKYFIFAIFDTLIYKNRNVMDKTLLERLKCAGEFAYFVRERPSKINIILKKMYKSYGFPEVYRDIPTLKHNNDGMIFTPIDLPYIPGRCDVLLKWKPAKLNTIDFKLIKHETLDYTYRLSCIKKKDMYITFDFYFDEEMEIVDRYDGLIGEFYYNETLEMFDVIDFSVIKGGWSLHKIRTDKTTPNSNNVAINVLQSIKENISYKDLEKHYFGIRNNWKQRENKNYKRQRY